MIFEFHFLRHTPQWNLFHALNPIAAPQGDPGDLAADFHMGGEVLLGTKRLGTGWASVASLFGVYRGQVPVQIRAVSEVFETVHTLHELLLEVNGLLVTVRVGLECEAGRALRAEVARRCRLTHRRAEEGLGVVERLGREMLTRKVGWALHVWPVQRQGHEREGVPVLVLPEPLQTAELPFAQGAGERLQGPGAGLWQDFLRRPHFFAQRHQLLTPSVSIEN